MCDEDKSQPITIGDEQLAVILRGIKARLEIALRQSSAGLTEEERLTHMVHVADSGEPYLLHLPCDDDAHWVERVALRPIALNPVANLIDELSHELSLLTVAAKLPVAPMTARAKKATKKRVTKK